MVSFVCLRAFDDEPINTIKNEAKKIKVLYELSLSLSKIKWLLLNVMTCY